jgi:hypothetical protein
MADRSERAREVAQRFGTTDHPDAGLFSEAIGLFAPLGWAMCGRWHRDGTLNVLRMAGEGASDADIDEALAELWNGPNEIWLRNAAIPLQSWANNHFPLKQVTWDRVTLLEKAIAHHRAGAYEASIPMIHAQLDGLSRDLTGASFYSKANNDPYVDDETLAGIDPNLPAVRRVFSEDVHTSDRHGLASRHGVMHGRDLAYATRINSTKSIVLVVALAEYFPRLADKKGAELRQAHEAEVAGSKGVDDRGRIIDDRELPEVHRFARDFDFAYANSILVPDVGPFDVDHQVDVIANRYGLEPEEFTRSGDGKGCWWHYSLPAGQVLGFATRPSTRSGRLHPDIWRWDAPTIPAEPPWSSASGWQTDEDQPRSPNWETRPIE